MANWGVIILLIGVKTPFITGRGPPCNILAGNMSSSNSYFMVRFSWLGDLCIEHAQIQEDGDPEGTRCAQKPVISAVAHIPFKWPKINGFAWLIGAPYC